MLLQTNRIGASEGSFFRQANGSCWS